jgi:hypothetical protein
MATPNDGKFRTSDLYFAAYLKVADVPFQTTELDGERTVFIFDRVEGMRDLRDQYYRRTSQVPALTYADEIQALKALVHMR